MGHAIGGQGVHQRVHHRGRGAHSAGLAGTLHAERVGLAGDLDEVHLDGGQVLGAGQGVVHEGGGKELAAFRVVDRALVQRLSDALGHAAMHLAAHDQRVDGVADIVHDDEEDVASSLAEMMESQGHEVVVCNSGESALAIAQDHPFDVVFTDLRMPGINGMELREALDAIRPGIKGRTIIMTGDTVLGAQAIAGDKDALLVLEKPFNSADVQMMLTRVLVVPSHRV